jgi:hypothetical protein
MALNTIRLYKIRKRVDSIFHYSNNAAFTAGIHACLYATFVGITNYANPERMSALHASVHATRCSSQNQIAVSNTLLEYAYYLTSNATTVVQHK